MKVIALWVPDATKAWEETTKRGAKSFMEPTREEDENGFVVRSGIHTYGETVHIFVERNDYKGTFLPGYRAWKSHYNPEPVGLKFIDHMVGNVGWGEMNTWVKFYAEVMGFAQLVSFDDKDISTEYTALMSKVMSNGNGRIKFPINEPAEGKKKSQIEEYIEFYNGAGVQHIAVATNDIIETVSALKDRGVEFLYVPPTLLRRRAGARRRDRRGPGGAQGARRPGRPRRRGLPAAALHQAGAGPPDDVLRDHPAQGREELRQGQLQGAVRGDRAGAGE